MSFRPALFTDVDYKPSYPISNAHSFFNFVFDIWNFCCAFFYWILIESRRNRTFQYYFLHFLLPYVLPVLVCIPSNENMLALCIVNLHINLLISWYICLLLLTFSHENIIFSSYKCECLPGFMGTYCEIPPRAPVHYPQTSVCQDHDCQNGGMCFQPPGSPEYVCNCLPGKYMKAMPLITFILWNIAVSPVTSLYILLPFE